MANPAPALRRQPGVPLSLSLEGDDGSTFQLDFRLSMDFNALALVEESTGLNLLGGNIWQNVSAGTLSVLFWASLLAHHPEYKGKEGLQIVRSYMDGGNATAIAKAVIEALIIGLPAEQQAAMRQAAGAGLEPVSSGTTNSSE